MARLHIGIDASRTAVAARTGTEQYTVELLGALARHDRHTRYTLYCNNLPAELPPLGTNFTLRRIPLRRLWTHARLSTELALHPPHVLFVPAHVIPLGAPLARRTRTVVTIHDLGYLHFPEAHTAAQRLYLRLSTAWSARVASDVIAISAATRDDLVRYARVPHEKIHVIHHGVAPRFRPAAAPAIAAAQARYNIDAPYFMFVGTVQPRKNLERVIEAFAALETRDLGLEATHLGREAWDGGLESRYPDKPQAPSPKPQAPSPKPLLIIVGKKGWLTEAIERKATALGVAERVRFIGYVPDADVPPLLSGAIGFVFPSLYEGFGMPVLEAMACGTPVITSTTSSLPEVAGDAALLVDPRDTTAITGALQRLAGEPTLRAELATRGQGQAARFTWDRCALETLQVLHKT